MAFDSTKLVPVSQNGSGVPDLWIYETADLKADVNTSGYFNDASGKLSVRDIILGVTDTGGTVAHDFYLVNSISSGVVDITDGDAIATTDTD